MYETVQPTEGDAAISRIIGALNNHASAVREATADKAIRRDQGAAVRFVNDLLGVPSTVTRTKATTKVTDEKAALLTEIFGQKTADRLVREAEKEKALNLDDAAVERQLRELYSDFSSASASIVYSDLPPTDRLQALKALVKELGTRAGTIGRSEKALGNPSSVFRSKQAERPRSDAISQLEKSGPAGGHLADALRASGQLGRNG